MLRLFTRWIIALVLGCGIVAIFKHDWFWAAIDFGLAALNIGLYLYNRRFK